MHYRPQPGAEAVPVQSSQTYSAPKAPATTPRSTASSAPPPVASCVITAPTADQVFPNAQSVSVSYTGPKGGKAELLLNGASRQTQPAGTAFTVSPVPRGTYAATVAITQGLTPVQASELRVDGAAGPVVAIGGAGTMPAAAVSTSRARPSLVST